MSPINYSLLLLALALIGITAQAAQLTANPANYRQQLKQLQPGDTLQLQPGTYRHGLSLHHLHGKPQQPIIIQAEDPQHPPRFVAAAKRNTISLRNASHLIIRQLLLDGLNRPNIDAVKAESNGDYTHHITLQQLTIVNHGANQMTVAISTKSPAWNWVIRDNLIIGAGTGIYLGDSDGSAPFIHGIIEHNRIIDTLGYNLQIKHQNTRPALAGIPKHHGDTLIRHNFFGKAQRSSHGRMARPNLLVGHFPENSEDSYVIYGNFFYQNPSEALFQGEGNIAFYNNILINQQGPGIRIKPHNDTPKRVLISNNTILAKTTGISFKGQHPRYQQQIINNLVFARRNHHAPPPVGRLLQAPHYLYQPFASHGKLNLGIHIDSPLFIAKPVSLAPYPDIALDFQGKTRQGKHKGAYAAGYRPDSLHIPQASLRNTRKFD